MPRRSDRACRNPIRARATCRRRYQTTTATPAATTATTGTKDSGSISTPQMSHRKNRSTGLNSLSHSLSSPRTLWVNTSIRTRTPASRLVSMRSTRPFASAHRSRRRKAWVSAPPSAITSPFRYVFPVSQSLTTRKTRYRGFCCTAMNSAIFAAAVDGIPQEPEAAEEAPRPRLRRRRIPHAADLLEEGAGEVELLRLLGEISDFQVLASEHGSRVRVLASDQDLEEGRLPGAVRTDEADLIALRELEVDVREEEAAAVGLCDALEAHDPGTRSARAEGEAEGARGGRG